jgi:hypothetical protein
MQTKLINLEYLIFFYLSLKYLFVQSTTLHDKLECLSPEKYQLCLGI